MFLVCQEAVHPGDEAVRLSCFGDKLIKKEDKDVEKKKLQQRLIAFAAAFSINIFA